MRLTTGKTHTQTSGFSLITLADLEQAIKQPEDLSRYQPDDKNKLGQAKANCPWFLPSDVEASKRKEAIENHNNYTCLVADIDDGNSDLEAIESDLKTNGIDCYYIYSTISSKPEDKRWRVVVPIAQAVDLDHWQALQAFLVHVLNGDDCTSRSQQISYLPARSAFNKEHYQFKIEQGEPLEVFDSHFAQQAALLAAEQQREHEEQTTQIKEPKPREFSLSSGQISPIEEFNKGNDWFALLAKYDFKKRGKKWLYPNSTSGTAGVIISYRDHPDGRYISSHSSDPLSDGYSHDKFDLYCQFEHAGDQDRAIKTLANELRTAAGQTITEHNQSVYKDQQNVRKLPNAVDANYGGLSKELFSSVSERVCSILSVNSLPEGTISLDVIDNVLNGSTWYAQQSKYYLMNHDNNFIPVREKDGVLFFSRTFGNAVDLNKISSEISTAAITNEIEKEKMESRVKTAVWGSLFDELRYRKHMTAVHYQVDMFISQGHVRELNDGVYSVVMPHKELKTGPYDHAIVDDFKEHFPFFCDFLDLLVNARFAPDRKKAYLWLQATSDFGKGFLTGALEHHGLVVSMTAKETESIFEGKPSSRQATDFLRAWALIFNEFKSVKSELKELESTIQMSPKNQMVQRAEIFAKVFFSADGVASMTGEHGVETQFANRFSYKKLSGNIEHRAMFKSVGKGAYMRSIQNYIAEHINKSVSTMRQLGKEDAEKVSSDWVDAFHTAHGIRNAFGDTADNIGEIADDFKAWCLETYRLETHLMDSNQRKIYKHLAESKNERVKFGIVSHDCLVTKPKTVFDIWVDATYSRSEKGMILKMKDKILEAVGDYTKHTTKQGKRANAYLIKNE